MRDNNSFTMEIAGGLGNQLFMFYAGLYFQEHFKREVVFDVSDLARIQKLHPGANIHTLGLLDGYQTTSSSIQVNNRIAEKFTKLIRFASKMTEKSLFTADELGFVGPEEIPSNFKAIRGYFQSWFYFNSLNEKPVLSINQFTNPSYWFAEKFDRSKNKNILSLHVRRGDYTLPANRPNGILSKDYYQEAVQCSSNIDSIWIFTDSPREVEEEFLQLSFPFEIIVPPSNSDPVESLLLMASTKKIVISNSTFSWWSAMFAGVGSEIYAPSKWYELREDPNRLIPESWNKIASKWVNQ